MKKIFNLFLFKVFHKLLNPIEYNKKLNQKEIEQKKIILKSYPTIMEMNFTNFCNANCIFCNKEYKNKPSNLNYLKPNTIKKLKWLKYIQQINLNAGIGDPLTSPYFIENIKMIKKIAPKSSIAFATNGINLKGKILDVCVQDVNHIHISLNAAEKKVHEKLFEAQIFDQIINNLEILCKIKPVNLTIGISIVLMKSTQNQIKPLIKLLHKLKLNTLQVNRLFGTSFLYKKMQNEYCYSEFSKEIQNEYINFAKEHQVNLNFAENIGPFPCFSPWTTAKIGSDNKGNTQFRFCCNFSPNININSKNALKNFKKIWNAPRLQFIRKTINQPKENPNYLCQICRNISLFDKDSLEKIQLFQKQNKNYIIDTSIWPLNCFSKIDY